MLNYFINYLIFIYLILLKTRFSHQGSSNLVDLTFSKANYLNYDQLKEYLHSLQSEYSTFAKVYTIGQSVEKRSLIVLKISNSIDSRPIGRPMVKYVASMHGDEAVGRQLLIYLSSYLLSNYLKLDRVKNILDSVELHFLFSMDPDGFEKAKEGNSAGNGNYTGRENAHRKDLNRDFPGTLIFFN